MDIELSASVIAVTVYSQQARLTAQASIKLEPGMHRLVVDDLPLTLDPSSVRASGSGSASVRLHGVEVRRHHYVETPAANVRDLETRIEQLEDELKVIADENEILEAQGRYLDGLRGASEQFARGLALGRTSVDEQAQISLFFREQDQAIRLDARELEQQKRELSRVLDKVRRELEQVKSARPRERNQALIELEVLTAGEFQAEIVYNVNRASWEPLYDVRLVEAESGYILLIEGIAQITQNSGQDWVDVDLKVSTARTELNRRLPELKPWYIDVLQPPVPRVASAPARAMAAPQPALSADVFEESVKGMAKPATAKMMSEEGGATLTFGIANKVNIPSDGSPHKTVLFERQIPATVDYVAVPKHTDAVYRRMKATNTGTMPLLAGSVQLFVGERYIGASRIDYIPAGDAVELMLGVEERLTIERELIRREVDKARLRDKRQIQYGYEITIKNLMPDSTRIEIHDHIPISRHEDIKVKLLSCAPEPAEHDDMNQIEWHLDLDSGAERKLAYQYQVEHPRSLRVMGLLD